MHTDRHLIAQHCPVMHCNSAWASDLWRLQRSDGRDARVLAVFGPVMAAGLGTVFVLLVCFVGWSECVLWINALSSLQDSMGCLLCKDCDASNMRVLMHAIIYYV